MTKGIKGTTPRCSHKKCPNLAKRRGLCQKHWQRFKKYGDPAITKWKKGNAEARWLSFVDFDGPMATNDPSLGPCWDWTGTLNNGGYPKFSVGQDDILAHRWGYEFYRGPIPDGLQLDHLACDRRLCVNPWHVEPKTARENGLRGNSAAAINARKTHCKRGHLFDEANTYHPPIAPHRRQCRTCARERMAAKRKTRP